jgi:hypothetical protein
MFTYSDLFAVTPAQFAQRMTKKRARLVATLLWSPLIGEQDRHIWFRILGVKSVHDFENLELAKFAWRQLAKTHDVMQKEIERCIESDGPDSPRSQFLADALAWINKF